VPAIENDFLEKHQGVQIFEAGGNVFHDEEAAHLIFSVLHNMLINPTQGREASLIIHLWIFSNKCPFLEMRQNVPL
jgi:uncharacterized protein (UPF0261 family)